jgi:glyoxylase-like metal-dependent hydrolase (beta-lactamase superfamily II)
VDLTRLPVGDGRISTAPESGAVWGCTTRFGGGGAHATGEWFRDDGTFDFTLKPTVDGEVSWPSHFTVSLQGDLRMIESNDLPDHPTGEFPVQATDDAFQFDRNPNSITEQTVRYVLPRTPSLASAPSCLPMGPVGVLLTGSYLFNALDARGLDAVAHEIQDGCQGHPEHSGAYHYHSLTTCEEDEGTGHSRLAGYALDGFGIYGRRGEGGVVLTNSDLDECHGHRHPVAWDAGVVDLYHYHATWEYPYALGCFRGTPQTQISAIEANPDQPPELSVVLLGTGSPVYNPERSGPSAAIRIGERFHLVDMGNGTQARMSEAGITVAELDALLVTHHHRDHNEEFTPITLLAALVGEPLIAGPPGTDRMVQFALDFYEEDLAYRARNRVRPGGPYELTAQDLIGGETIELPGIRIATARVNHSIHAVAYRFDAGDESIVVSGDLTYSPSLSELARGADVLVIDYLDGDLAAPRQPARPGDLQLAQVAHGRSVLPPVVVVVLVQVE